MEVKNNPEIQEILKRLNSGMIDYIPHASYSAVNVKQCIQIIENYLLKIEETKSKESGMELVKNTVTSLNELNEKLDFELIETDQREDIAEIIILGGSLKGYNDRNEDITEDWREW